MLGMIGNPLTGWRNPFAEMERLARQMEWLTSGVLARTDRPFFNTRRDEKWLKSKNFR